MKNSNSNVHADFNSPPVPGKNPSRLMVSLTKMVGEDPFRRFGTQLIRIASDMIAVCNEDLEIIFHNRAFLKGMGHRDGSFTGQSLLSFFPTADQLSAESAFSGLITGHAAGLRINASVLKRHKVSQFDIRVVKSRMQNGEFLYYLIAREEASCGEAPSTTKSVIEKKSSFFDALPIAVWRTDKRLKITNVEGPLWEEMGVDTTKLIGESVEDGSSSELPSWFKRFDFCDTMAGQSRHLEVKSASGNFDVTIEPVLNEKNRVIGTVGFFRKSKIASKPKSDTQVVVSIGKVAIAASKVEPINPPSRDPARRPAAALPETKKVALPAIANAVEKAKSSARFQAQASPRQVFPRPMTPPDLDVCEKDQRATGSTSETKAVALSR